MFNILLQNDLTKKANRKKNETIPGRKSQIMHRMIENNPAAGLYIPIHLLVYEQFNGKVIVEYDLPSSSFGQFNNSEIHSDSIILENKLSELIHFADNGNSESIATTL
jgi:hypothetical protein